MRNGNEKREETGSGRRAKKEKKKGRQPGVGNGKMPVEFVRAE